MNHRYLSRCEREKLPSTIEKSSIYTINPFPFIILRYQGPNYSLQIPLINKFSNHTNRSSLGVKLPKFEMENGYGVKCQCYKGTPLLLTC